MSSRILTAALWISALSVLATLCFSQQPQPAATHKWRYKIIDSNALLRTEATVEDGLNSLGEQGWELVNAERVVQSGNAMNIFYLKRQVVH